jgi:AcrR family transcriptional regulator
MVRSNTREEILAAAARLFATIGYKGTSLQVIAAAVGCSKATLLYHFATKDDILATLVAPPARDLAALAEKLDRLDAAAARELAIEGFVDLVLIYRQEISLIFHDMTYLFHAPSFAELKVLSERLAIVLAGGSTDAQALLGVNVMMAGIAAVALDRPEHGDVDLRGALIGVARRALVTNA